MHERRIKYGTTEGEGEEKWCCIAHQFYSAASSEPEKVSVIHASGRSRLSRRRQFTADSHPSPPAPPYSGDEFFTFSQLLSTVDSLSFRLRRVLDGALDDPCLRIPNLPEDSFRNNSVYSQACESFNEVLEHSSCNSVDGHLPKIIAVYMVPSVHYICAVLSILRCGEAFMPIDPSWPKERILSVLSSSNVDLIICCQHSEKLSYGGSRMMESEWLLDSCSWPVLTLTMGESGIEESCHFNLAWPCEAGKRRTFSYIMCTSGSAGKSKGVCGTEEGLLNRFWWLQELYPLQGKELLLFKTPISFIDHIQEFLASVLTACTLVIPPVNELKENMFSLLDFLQDYSISRLTVVPSLVKTLLPPLRSPYYAKIISTLKLLMISGETFHISLWRDISSLLPRTSILNIYGSTEVSADCTYFDCKRLQMLLESHTISSVPIGVPITNCDVILLKGDGLLEEGEICVNGHCLSIGYISDSKTVPFDYVEIPDDSLSMGARGRDLYFRTGDLARQLSTGDLVFLGRKDRTVKVNGQRIALEEVEDTLRGHPGVVDAAVVFNEVEYAFLRAFVVLKDSSIDVFKSIRSWMIDRLPTAMIPKELCCTEVLPRSSTGKVDYASLSGISLTTHKSDESGLVHTVELEEKIRKAFSHALTVEFSHDSNFFHMGGDSVTAAHVAHDLGIDMRLIYMFPTSHELRDALLEKDDFAIADNHIDWDALPRAKKRGLLHSESQSSLVNLVEAGRSNTTSRNNCGIHSVETSKRLKLDHSLDLCGKGLRLMDVHPWTSSSTPKSCAISRCNRVMYHGKPDNDLCYEARGFGLPRQSTGFLQEWWKVDMESCIDSSPVIVFHDDQALLFIGSHSHKFLCVDAKSGLVQWELKLEGRIECSAVIDGDFCQVIVGCYKGEIYFIDYKSGKICWSFQTRAEVKAQPIVDKSRHLVWCGSHDHVLYALDYRSHRCVYQYPCGGSVFSSPVIDQARNVLYVATTTGCLTAISLKTSSFSKLWLLKLEAPVFGSLAVCSLGNVICCFVNGYVVSINHEGSMVWRVKTDGPIFAGACLSRIFPSQAIICSRGGSVYCLQLENGSTIWEYNVGAPITASACIDEHLMLTSDPSSPGDRLICVCSSSGKILLLRTTMLAGERDEQKQMKAEKFTELDIPGEIFSSPVMVGGRIFVGARDDYLHCFVTGAHTGS